MIRQAEQLEKEVESASGFGGVLHRSLALVFGRPLATQRKLIRRLQSSTEDTFRLALQKVPAKWLRELLAIDSRGVYDKIACPVLLVGAEKDIQCDPADVDRIAALVQGGSDVHRIDNLTHVLRCTEAAPSFLGVDALLAEPVDPSVLELVADWLEEQESAQEAS